MLNHTIPKINVRIVIGTPAFRYSLNSNLIPRFFADLATIRFATEPISVRLPANVDDIANVNQMFSGLIKLLTTGLNNKTAGTFDMTLLNSAVTIEISKTKFPEKLI